MPVKVEVVGGDVEAEVDRDIDEFERWFTENVDTTGGPALSKPERAIIKSYLWYKIHDREVQGGQTSGG